MGEKLFNNPRRVYSLSFKKAHGHVPRFPGEIIITSNVPASTMVIELAKLHAGFSLSEHHFGLGGCGKVRNERDLVHYRFELMREKLDELANSIHFVLEALNRALSHVQLVGPSESPYQFAMVMADSHNPGIEMMYPISGSIFPDFRRRLAKIAEREKTPSSVIDALSSTWNALKSSTQMDLIRNRDAWIHPDGSFSINCGQGSIGLDLHGDQGVSDKLSALYGHNIYGAMYQLTLLAGLAALWDLAQQE